MKIKMLKEMNLKKKMGQMMFKIRMANKDQEKKNQVYREFGVADYEGNVIDMEVEFFDIKEKMYQTNNGLPYSELFPKMNYEEEINELVALMVSPIFVEQIKGNRCLIGSEKAVNRIEKYKGKLIQNGVKEKDMMFLNQWKENKDYTTKATYENLIKDSDLILMEFSEENYKEKIKEKQKELEMKYGVTPEHWIIEKEI